MYKLKSHHHLHADLKPAELTKLSWSQTLTSLGGGLVAIFIPIFLLHLGYSLSQVFLYMMWFGLSPLMLAAPEIWLLLKIGANRMMALSSVGQAVFLALLITLPTYHWPLYLLAILAAAVNMAYWAPFHANFSASRTPGKAGEQLSYIYVLMAVAGAIAPAVGGILATTFGIKLVYGISAGLFLAAAIPMLKGAELIKSSGFDLRRLKNVDMRSDMLAYAGWAVTETTELVIWPILIFLIVTSYAAIGLLSSVLIVTGTLTTLYVGRREERTGEKHYLKEGSVGTSLTNTIRQFASGGSTIFGMNLLSGISFHLLEVSFFTRYYKRISRNPRLEYVYVMEVANSLSIALFYLILYLASLNLPNQAVLAIGLILTIPGSYLATRIR